MNSPLRAVIVDDEERARKRLARMLEAWPSIRVVGEASNGTQAVGLIDQLSPDVVFLDVQMPEVDGFEVLSQLPRPPRYVVFTTAYDQYAINAFAVGAVDYLLKPFGEREVARAVERALDRSAEEKFRQGYGRMMASHGRLKHLERIPVTYLKDIVLVPVATITDFEADNEMVAIHTLGTTYETDLTLAELENRLDPGHFFRAHRRAIINLDQVVRLERIEGGRLIAVLGGEGRRVEVSRTASKKLREILGIA